MTAVAVEPLELVAGHRLLLGRHLPLRPDWTCAGDGMAWPCPLAKAKLLPAYDGAELDRLMGGYLVEAAGDIGDPRTLWCQFMEWTQPKAGRGVV